MRPARGATWSYTTTDNVAPSVEVDPPASTIVRRLTRIRITFDEPVVGVDAGDLLINGVPAAQVSGAGSGPYTFSFTQPATGAVQVAFAAGAGILDVASPANAFAGGARSYVLDPAIPTDIGVRHVIQMSLD